MGHALRNEDIAAHIVAAHSELRFEAVVSIFSTRDEIVCDAITQNMAVQDGWYAGPFE
ncbi:MAG: hypothetical protein LBD58_00985 [Treponema sp.]|nr:hypothetical protein [Treponema sp.]